MVELVIKPEVQQAMCATVVKISANLTVMLQPVLLFLFCSLVSAQPVYQCFDEKKIGYGSSDPSPSPHIFLGTFLCMYANYKDSFATPGLVCQCPN